jgi:hypothetical protein
VPSWHPNVLLSCLVSFQATFSSFFIGYQNEKVNAELQVYNTLALRFEISLQIFFLLVDEAIEIG